MTYAKSLIKNKHYKKAKSILNTCLLSEHQTKTVRDQNRNYEIKRLLKKIA